MLRVLMRLSFNDEESFKETAESLRFFNPPSDQDTFQQIGMPLQDFERNEDSISPNDPKYVSTRGKQ